MIRALLVVMMVGGVAAADDVCTPVSAADKKALEIDVKAFIDHEHPGEKQPVVYQPELAFVINVGCREPGGTVYVDVSQDRSNGKQQAIGDRRNYILAIAKNHQATIVEESRSTPSDLWQEWADEGRLALIAQLDLDEDGKRDVIFSQHDHEGGDMNTYDTLYAQLATGKRVKLVRVENLESQRIVDGRLVLASHDRIGDRSIVACVMKDLSLARCPAAQKLQRTADRKWTHDENARRHVDAFLESKNLDNAYNQLFVRDHDEATRYMDQLGSQLGDARCKPDPLPDETKQKLVAWAMKQGADRDTLSVTEECGSYAWVQYLRKGDPDAYEFLMSTSGTDPVKVQKFKYDGSMDNGFPLHHHYEGAFFMHGKTVVGWVIRNLNLFVIANGKTVATSHGDYRTYGYDRRWLLEDSYDLFWEPGNAYWHATPTGFERVDAEPMREHDAKRAALEYVIDNEPSPDDKYIVALHLLGADSKLIAECRKQ